MLARFGLAQQRHDAFLVDGGDDQDVDALGDEVLRRRDLLGDVEVGVLHLDLDAELGGVVLHALDDVLVPFVRRVVDDVADLLRRFLRQGRPGGQHHGSGGEKQFLGQGHAYLPMTVGFSSGRFVPPSRVVTISLTYWARRRRALRKSFRRRAAPWKKQCLGQSGPPSAEGRAR